MCVSVNVCAYQFVQCKLLCLQSCVSYRLYVRMCVRLFVCVRLCVCISGCTGGIYSLLKGFQRVRFKAISSSSLDSRDAVGVVLGPAKLLQAATTTVSCPDRDVCLAGFASDRARQVKANIATQS